MYRLKHKLILGILLMRSTFLCADSVVPSMLNFRSQSRDTAAKIYGSTYQMHLYSDCQDDTCHGTLFIRPAYFRSFQASKLARDLFGDVLVSSQTTNNCSTSCSEGMFITGTPVDETGAFIIARGEKDLMAENFYLPQDFESFVSFDPVVTNFIVDFHLFLALDQWCPGLYFRLYGPFAHAKYNLGFSENVINPGTIANGFYPPGYFNDTYVEADQLLRSFEEYARGDTPPINNPGVTIQGLVYSKILCGAQTENGFADLRCEIGYDFLLEECYHFGFNIQFAAPTGPKQKPDLLFPPQIGNGHHWELGAGLTGHISCWQSEDELSHLELALEADVTHMFGVKMYRTLDLVDKGLSRYMLAARFNESSAANSGLHEEGNDAVVPNRAFAYEYTPLANITTQQVKVSAAVQADVTIMANYTCGGLGIDLGYNFWYRSCEKIELDPCNPFPSETWGLKGDASMFGFTTETITNPNPPPANIIVPNLNDPIALSATEINATIHSGTNILDTTVDPLTNPNIDNPVLAATFDSTGTEQILVMGTELTPDPTSGIAYAQIYTSVQPFLLTQDDLDVKGAATKGLSNKFFAHVSYTWIDCEGWIPYVGIGAQAEIGKNSSSGSSSCNSTITNTGNNCPSCKYASLTQWGVWIKAGISWE